MAQKALTVDASPAAKAARTDALLFYWNNHKNEWNGLFGLLCITHSLNTSSPEFEAANELFDSSRIAKRLDEIREANRQAAIAALEAHKSAAA
jgi:hypothetical protein